MDLASQSCVDHHNTNQQERQRTGKIVMKRPSQIIGSTRHSGRNVRGSTHLPSLTATNIRGTLIAKSVISSQSRFIPVTRVGPQPGPRDAKRAS
jgi:hypothetical protein